MNAIFDINELNSLPNLQVKNQRIVGVSNAFLEFTGYSKDEILHHTFTDICTKLLRVHPIDLNSSIRTVDSYIFTKQLSAREVRIKAYPIADTLDTLDTLYSFIEKPASRLEDHFKYIDQLCRFNTTAVAIYSAPEFKLLKASQKYLNIFHESFPSPEFALGLSIQQLSKTKVNRTLEALLKNTINTGSPLTAKEVLHCDSAGEKTYWDCTITPVFINSAAKYCILHAVDETDRVFYRTRTEKQHHTVIRQKEELEAILDNITDAVMIFDKDGNYSKLNKTALDYFFKPSNKTYKIEDILENVNLYTTHHQQYTLEDLSTYKVTKGEKLKNRRVILRKPDRDIYLDMSGTPVADANGNFIMGVLCGHDITETVKYEEILNDRYDQLYKMFDKLGLPILRFCYPEYTLIDVNQKAIREMHEIVGGDQRLLNKILNNSNPRKLLFFFSSREILSRLREMEDTKEVVHHDKVEVFKNGKKGFYKAIYQPILNSKGDIAEVLFVGMDITSEVEQNEMLEYVLKMKDEFLSIISHEFKTPLTVINSAVQAMELICRDELSEKSRSFLSSIRQNSFRQLRLVNNLLDITRTNTGQIKINKRNMDVVFLTKVITESVALYAQQKGIKLSFSSKLSYRIIGIDEEKYERILLNLLSNAIKFTPTGKKVSVRVYLKVIQSRQAVCIDVKDQGIGIPHDKLDLIFERFGQVDSSLTRQAEGTGIGLSLVKQLVHAHGGDIKVESLQSKGSTFTVILPAKKTVEASDDVNKEFADNRLVQMAAIEFSDIYL